jgi:hypothetical protein
MGDPGRPGEQAEVQVGFAAVRVGKALVEPAFGLEQFTPAEEVCTGKLGILPAQRLALVFGRCGGQGHGDFPAQGVDAR